MLHSIKLPNSFHCTHSNMLCSTLLITITCTLPACLTYTPDTALKMLPNSLPRMLSRMLPIAINHTLPACSSYSSMYAPIMFSSTLPDTLPSILSTGKTTWPYICIYTPGCLIERLVELQLSQNWGMSGGRLVAVAEILMSANSMVYMLF